MKLENIIYGRIKVFVQGLNLDRVLKILKNRKIELKRIKKLAHNELQFFVSSKHKKQMLNCLEEYNYKTTVQAYYGIPFIIDFFKKRIGILIGSVIFIALTLFFSSFVWNIEVYGLENIQKEQVIETLYNKGIAVGKQLSDNNLEEAENYLESQIEQISMVSIMKKGSTILVNLKEVRIPAVMINVGEATPLISNYDGVITKINVVQGTALVKVGDVVKVGDTLVAGYFTNLSGANIPCVAMADVFAKVWYSATVQFDTKKTEWVETGNYVETTYLSLAKNNFNIKNNLPVYESYKVKISSKFLFFNNIIPIKINKIRYCELTPILIEQNFDENKEKLEQQALILAKDKMPNTLTPQKEFTTIQINGTMYLVSAYIECETNIQAQKQEE